MFRHKFYVGTMLYVFELNVKNPAFAKQKIIQMLRVFFEELGIHQNREKSSVQFFCFFISEKIKTFLQEYYVDGKEEGKDFVYGQQLVSVKTMCLSIIEMVSLSSASSMVYAIFEWLTYLN